MGVRKSAAGAYRTPLGRVRGLGSARTGSTDWLRQRISGLLLIPLGLWLGLSLAHLPTVSYADALAWLRAPWNTGLAVAVAALAFLHGHLGLRVIIEDYVHIPSLKVACLLLAQIACAAAALAALLSILRIAVGG